MKTKISRRNSASALRNWDFFLYNGEFAGTFSYTRAMIKAQFDGAMIKGTTVILTA